MVSNDDPPKVTNSWIDKSMKTQEFMSTRSRKVFKLMFEQAHAESYVSGGIDISDTIRNTIVTLKKPTVAVGMKSDDDD